MSYRSHLESIPPDRLTSIVHKIYTEIHSDASSHENKKEKFLSLVTENDELSENEKRYCKERFAYDFELNNAIYKQGKPKECSKCGLIRYSDKYCENCIGSHLQERFSSWTSGNDIVDNFIQKCQKLSSLPTQIMEWIPFDQFKDVEYLTSGGFSNIYTATWIRGHLFDYDENENEFGYYGRQSVALKLLNNSNEPGKNFFEEVSSNFHYYIYPLI